MSVLMDEIDALRTRASDLITKRRLLEAEHAEEFCHCGEPPQWLCDVRDELRHTRTAIEYRLAKYHAQSDCPYCPGKLQPTPTKHVLRCDHCAAVTLPGRMAMEIIRVEAK